MLLSMGATAQTLQINEVMQSNIDGIMDDLNDFPDSWVELYNPTAETLNLKDYRIGISNSASTAWQMPDRVVLPGGYAVVYCDKVGSGMHADFRLETTKNSYVYLFKGADIVSRQRLPVQPAPHIAYGGKTDGSDEWGYQLAPSPGRANTGGICDKDHLLGEPRFSREGVVMEDGGSLSVTLSAPEGSPEGTVIRYTLDGSEPTEESAAYTAPLVFDTTKVLRAKLFCSGWLSPRSTCHSYIFFPGNRRLTLPVISIQADARYFDDPETGIFANNDGDHRVDWRRPVNIELFEAAGKESVINQLGETRVMGGASRGAALKSLAVYANKRFGSKRFDYEFFPDQKPGMKDFKSILLRNSGNDFDYLYMRDAIIQRSMGCRVDLDWQAWKPAIVYINGRYKGILNIRERSNEDYVYNNYDELEDLDMFENWNELKEGTRDNFDAFKAFYNEQGHTMAEYEERMDCIEFANLMIMNLFHVNLDFPGNNIVMWRPTAKSGKWRFIAKDTDFGLGLYNRPYNYQIFNWLYNPNYDSSNAWANKSEHTRLFRQLMEVTEFRQEFIDRCCIYVGDFLNERGIRAVWDPMYETIKTEFPYHRELYMTNKWWPRPYTDELNDARAWLKIRPAEFIRQLGEYYQLGSPVPLIINLNGQEMKVTFNGVQLNEKTFNGHFFSGRSIQLCGETPAGQEVKGWRLIQDGVVSQTDGNTLNMVMPDCKTLIISPVLGDASGVSAVETGSYDVKAVYSLQGERRQSLLSGVNIVVYANGESRKVVVK